MVTSGGGRGDMAGEGHAGYLQIYLHVPLFSLSDGENGFDFP